MRASVGFRVAVGGGLGRTPIVGHVIREFLPRAEILNYLDAILRVYNRFGRRDNKYKARIKILVKERTPGGVRARSRSRVGAPARRSRHGARRASSRDWPRSSFRPPTSRCPATTRRSAAAVVDSRPFENWVGRNVHPHKVPGYAIVTLSLKKTGVPPGDVTSDQMDAIADLADRYSFGELRVSHEQNLVFTDVKQGELLALWRELKALGLATPNVGLLTNIVCCPGGDFCSLANAKSIPIAEAIQRRFDDLDYLHDIGELDLNISGCMNACGHHHVGHIGVLGVDKNGSEWYQVTIGGTQGEHAAIGRVIGPSFAADEMPDVVARLDRDLRRPPPRRRAVRRHRSPRRHRTLQGARLCNGSLGTAQCAPTRTRWCGRRRTLADLPEATPVIVPLALWHKARAALVARGDAGVWLAPGDDPATLAPDVARVPVSPSTSRRSPTAAATRRRGCCASGTATRANCARSATCSATSSTTCSSRGSTRSRSRDDKDAAEALAGLRDFSDGYQRTQRRAPWFRRRDLRRRDRVHTAPRDA